MIIPKPLFVSVYSPHKRRRPDGNSFLRKLYTVTGIISAVLIGIGVFFASQLPGEAFSSAFTVNTPNKKNREIILPEPTREIQIKADRLRQIRYEDYLENCYTPLEGELDNIYINDYAKKCYLTFDDGPGEVTEKILDVLKQYKVKATFFVIGERVKENPEILKAIAKDGHSIGNHSYSHDYNVLYESADSFKKEVLNCRKAINTALGTDYDNLLFRFPGGYDSLTNERTKAEYRKVLIDLGYKYTDWSCLTGDSNTTSPTFEYLMNTLEFSIGNTKTGDIVVLMHDSATKEITAETLPKIIEYLYDKGFEFEPLTNTK